MAPPIYVKGGVWTNVEDQILKAAVSKYGLTQWARVASLLPKKTAKQAKARWNEYLNPSIRENDWDKKDDAKLLDVAKLLPNQWRSVAQIMGRTATQCVERYQKLLDSAVNGASDDEHAENVDLTGPGIEALPALGNAFESLPSRPDAEDMDEDEREMLSEAKARLANTQGKKAKRKDRERLLAESRRIALLQKRRELKAAGISVSLTSKNKARRKEFDYNADIPHERQPLPGKYDVSAEDSQNMESHLAFQKSVNIKGLGEGAKRKEKEPRASIKAAAGLVTRVDEQLTKRRKLDLPDPGATDDVQNLDSPKHLDSPQNLDSHPVQVSQHLTAHDTEPLSGAKRPFSRKKIVSEFKKLLSQMPQPTKERQVPFHAAEVGVPSEPIANANALQLLRQVEEQTTQSQVVQQGLPIPSLDVFEVQDHNPIASQILHEARLLVKSDHDQKSLPPQVEPLDPISRQKAEALVELDMGARADQSVHPDVGEPKLPESDQTIDIIYELLNDLNTSAHELEFKTSHSQGFLANAQTFTSLCEEIDHNSELLHNYTSELKTTTDIAQDEEIAIQTRLATLSDLVESVRAAENRIKSQVQSHA